MDQKTLESINKWMAFGQVILPRLLTIVADYDRLKDDPRLHETDREKMVANLQMQELTDWKDL